MHVNAELLKGATELAVLAALADAPAHGYELAQRLRSRSAGVLRSGEGTLYPLLYKLEKRGDISARWVVVDRRRRRVYRLTPRGRGLLSRRGNEWQELVTAMAQFLGGPAHA